MPEQSESVITDRTESTRRMDIFQKRIHACTLTVEEILREKLEPEDKEILTGWQRILTDGIQLGDKGILTEHISSQICRITVGLLDQLFVDEIAPYDLLAGKSVIEKKAYSRIEMGSTLSFLDNIPGELQSSTLMPITEANSYLKCIKGELPVIHQHKSIEDLLNHYNANPNIRVMQLIDRWYTLDEIQATLVKRNLPKNQNVYGMMIPVKIGDIAGFIFVGVPSAKGKHEGKKIIYALTTAYLPEISSAMSEQDVWYSLFKEGIPLFSKDRHSFKFFPKSPVTRSQNISLTELQNKIDVFLQTKFGINKGIDSIVSRKVKNLWLNPDSDYQSLQTQHTSFYRKEFGILPDGETAAVTVTRSGVSALELAIGTTLENFQQRQEKPLIFKLPGWYPENADLPPEDFTDDAAKANILLINHEPNYPGLEDSQNYIDYRDRAIQELIDRARRNSTQTFALIYDKTTDLSAHAHTGSGWPANLLYIEAASLTKHQRGLRHGFYGVVWSFGPDTLPSPELTYRYHASLTEYGVATFPHITANEHRRVRESFIAQGKRLNELFLTEFPEAAIRWNLETYSYYFFLVPQAQKIFEQFLRSYRPRKAPTLSKEESERLLINNFYTYLEKNGLSGTNLNNLLNNWALRHINSVEKGDSYGLEKIRVTTFGIPIDINKPDGQKLNLRIPAPRISFGLSVGPEESLDVIKNLFQALNRRPY